MINNEKSDIPDHAGFGSWNSGGLEVAINVGLRVSNNGKWSLLNHALDSNDLDKTGQCSDIEAANGYQDGEELEGQQIVQDDKEGIGAVEGSIYERPTPGGFHDKFSHAYN